MRVKSIRGQWQNWHDRYGGEADVRRRDGRTDGPAGKRHQTSVEHVLLKDMQLWAIIGNFDGGLISWLSAETMKRSRGKSSKKVGIPKHTVEFTGHDIRGPTNLQIRDSRCNGKWRRCYRCCPRVKTQVSRREGSSI
ncbi:hypothetical protein TELCIR_25114 [Teladorsagia circumcincta]|uniref:Uncharacterized protein n=1 Tax=Teladorsagia circumcincta TaxID=45464 RepID=A0A2G9T6G9_TELCI|nr:hypothetical protein TELCIR_25114 [Teladorsagia circumcincta]